MILQSKFDFYSISPFLKNQLSFFDNTFPKNFCHQSEKAKKYQNWYTTMQVASSSSILIEIVGILFVLIIFIFGYHMNPSVICQETGNQNGQKLPSRAISTPKRIKNPKKLEQFDKKSSLVERCKNMEKKKNHTRHSNSYSYENDLEKQNYEINIKPPLFDSFCGERDSEYMDDSPSPRFNPSSTSSSPHPSSRKSEEQTKFMNYRLKTLVNYVDILKGQMKELTREIQHLKTENKRNVSSFQLVIGEYREYLEKEMHKKLALEEQNEILKNKFIQFQKQVEQKARLQCIDKTKSILGCNIQLKSKKDRKFSEQCAKKSFISNITLKNQNMENFSMRPENLLNSFTQQTEENPEKIYFATFEPAEELRQKSIINNDKSFLKSEKKFYSKEKHLSENASKFEQSMETIRNRLQNLRKKIEGEIENVEFANQYTK